MRENDLIELPKEIGELNRLRELHIQGNRLTVLPPEIGTLSELNSLIIRIMEEMLHNLPYRKPGFSQQ